MRIDPHVSLATSLAASPGVYALMIGSGVSTGVQIPTGYGVMRTLVRQAAAASGAELAADFDSEKWWVDKTGEQPGYSNVLEYLAPSPASRQALLAQFFEPSEEDMQAGHKVPGPAHREIAELVRRGTVRVIVTTNFDRLLERAISDAGVSASVVDSDAAIAGMIPLAHAKCTIIKVHGDYASLNQRNTLGELAEYSSELKGLLGQVFNDYGLILCGWSADWDGALRDAMYASAQRRYPWYWSTMFELSSEADRLAQFRQAVVLPGETADQFFENVTRSVQAVERLKQPPITREVAVSRLRRALPDPVRRIELRDIIESQVAEVEAIVVDFRGREIIEEWIAIAELHEEMVRSTDTLLHLLAHGVYLDRDDEHLDLWLWAVDRLAEVGAPAGPYLSHWSQKILSLPAVLSARALTLASILGRREETAVSILTHPLGSHRSGLGPDELFYTLRLSSALSDDTAKSIWEARGTPHAYAPAAHLAADYLSGAFESLSGTEEAYERLFKRVEYRIALAGILPLTPGRRPQRPKAGLYTLNIEWNDPYAGRTGTDGFKWQADFVSYGDQPAWGRDPSESEAFEKSLDELTGVLRQLRPDW